MTPGRQRRAQRAVHLLAAVVLFAHVYAPLGSRLEDVVRFAVFPGLALTGIAMWQSARIRAERFGRGAAEGGSKRDNAPRGRREGPMRLREMDDQVTYMEQLQAGDGPIVLVNVFNVAPEDAERLLEVWAEDAAFMKRQPGFVSTQLHRGTAGSSTFVNVAEWESAGALGRAFSSPEFQRRLEEYPNSVVASPHVFEKVAIPGI
jgi:heme-degrading monooxygenase HmoA